MVILIEVVLVVGKEVGKVSVKLVGTVYSKLL